MRSFYGWLPHAAHFLVTFLFPFLVGFYTCPTSSSNFWIIFCWKLCTFQHPALKVSLFLRKFVSYGMSLAEVSLLNIMKKELKLFISKINYSHNLLQLLNYPSFPYIVFINNQSQSKDSSSTLFFICSFSIETVIYLPHFSQAFENS